MKVAIAGIAGFIGSQLAAELHGRGFSVFGFDDLSTGHESEVPHGVRFEQGSIFDREMVFRFCQDAHVLINCACVQMPDAVIDPFLENKVDVLGSLVMAEAARVSESKLIHISSCSVYGHQPDQERIREDAPFYPFTPYSAGKIAGESYVRAYHAHGWIDATVLRPSNVYGPGQHPQRHAGVIGRFVWNKIHGRTSVLHGGGGATRDFTYVGDVCKAIARSTSIDFIGPMNIASGTGVGIDELAGIIGGEYENAPKRDIDLVPYRVLDPSLAEQRLGWKAGTTLEDGIEKTEEWLRSCSGVISCA